MNNKPSYDELLKRVKKLEREALENKKIRAELQESEKRLHAIINNSTAVIYLKDLDGKYIMVNKYYEKLFRMTSKQVIGKTDFDLFPLKNAELFHTNDLSVLKKNGTIEFEELVPSDSGIRTYISIKFPLHNVTGDIYAICGISTEITERKKLSELLKKSNESLDQLVKERTSELMLANEKLTREIEERKIVEQALLESERSFRNIFENLQDVYFETTLDGKIKNASPSGSDFSGYSLDELIGNRVEILYYDPSERKKLLKELKIKGRVRDFEALFRKKTGEPYHVSVNADIYFDENNEPAGMTGTIRDITQYKRMKERLQQANKMESLGLMAGGIAHDLNNILSGIVTYPEVLLANLPEDSPLKKPLTIIQDSGQRAADVVFDLLTMARGVTTEKIPLNLNTIIEEFLNSGEYTKITKDYPGINYKNRLEKDLLNTKCSSHHVKMILLNLIINASEAINENGTIIIKTENRFLEKSLPLKEDMKTGEYVQLSVSDTGGGISQTNIERIFEPFFTKKRMKRSGTGLGLTVVWNTVQDHGGHIDVKSNHKGTMFEILFPATREKEAAIEGKLSMEDYRGSGEHILVVDDEEFQREIACDLLEKLGYNASSVSSGEDAIEYIKKNNVDLMVLDMIMEPGINGAETYKRVSKVNPGQKAVIATGYTSNINVEQAKRLGAGQFVKKPYTIYKIGIAIKNELKK